MAVNTRKDTTADALNPFLDLTRKFEQFKMPGVDMPSFVEARRKDVEALVTTNKMAYETLLALGRAQAAMLTQTLHGMQESAKAMMTGGMSGAESAKHTEAAQLAWQKIVADMTQLAESVRKSQVVAMAALTERAADNLRSITGPAQVQ